MNAALTKCVLCNVNLEQTNLKNTSMPWKDFPNVIVLKDLYVWGCPECGEKIISGNEITALDDILKFAIKEETSHLISEIKNKSGLSQKELSMHIGISEVYLSKLISKKTIPSFEKFNYLRLLNQTVKYLTNNVAAGILTKHTEERKIHIVDLTKYEYLNEDERIRYSTPSQFCRILEHKQV
ncbi:helix-turn-helix domain-containing protein [Candidatus Berkiella aquae]|uniref:Helix-turn-helix domain-containing protein n=1 Tax=Candidatus Berkiella aquae TaxID=295108 RepID=A0A0Q9YNP0_9GAMM|nr:helix-turn-helix domain-containing protein [Candidatus Berkiella aquae]MCS5712377.1 helix-turn-helix domain-containing protein [Candidatus Berkiella aquae]